MTANTELANPDPAVVTVWSDVGCPWAALALYTLRAAAATRDQPLLIDHRAFTLEFVHGTASPKPIVDVEAAAIGARLPELGLQLWNAPDYTYPSTLLPALEAIQAAKDPAVGGLPGSDELQARLSRAYFAESRCISLHAVILDVARDCPHVDVPALASALELGRGRAEVYRQWRTAKGPHVQGSPHVLTAGGFNAFNPGASLRWTARPPVILPEPGVRHGFPVFEAYDPTWTDELLGRLEHGSHAVARN